MKILVLNGPNLNLLGSREPKVYGTETLSEIVADLEARAGEMGAEITSFQSNSEGALIDQLHEAMGWADGVVFNPGAYHMTSYALRDAIAGMEIPVVETHLSNVHAREEFRHVSVISGVCLGVVAGFGRDSYRVALEAVVAHIRGA